MPTVATSLAARQVALLVAIVAVLLGVMSATMSGTAEARPKDGGYPCWISDHGWMTCYDV